MVVQQRFRSWPIFLVGDSRSGMCFSEATIGLIPGWSGIARTLVKAGPINAEYMAKTAKEIKADQLKAIGSYNVVVDVPFPFPKRQRTDDRDADKAKYQADLETHNDETGMLLLPESLELGARPAEEISKVGDKDREILATKDDISAEVARRENPENYSELWGKPLREVAEEIAKLGRPLAPQSIAALNSLIEDYDPSRFDESSFVEREMKADARLYRDPRFRAGLIATLEQKVGDYRL